MFGFMKFFAAKTGNGKPRPTDYLKEKHLPGKQNLKNAGRGLIFR